MKIHTILIVFTEHNNQKCMNKYILMAHNQEELKTLGNLVASHKKVPLFDILNKYTALKVTTWYTSEPRKSKVTNISTWSKASGIKRKKKE